MIYKMYFSIREKSWFSATFGIATLSLHSHVYSLLNLNNLWNHYNDFMTWSHEVWVIVLMFLSVHVLYEVIHQEKGFET